MSNDSRGVVLSNPRLAFELAPDDPLGASAPRHSLKQPLERETSADQLNQVERKAYSLVRGPSEVMLNRMVVR
jgi:hypothetical protein